MNYLEGLNPAQKEAVETTEGPLLVLAGAGSGKTRVITYRILNLIQKGVAPHNILAVTFTNKAAKEMKERVHALINEHFGAARAGFDSLPVVTTFHALGVRIIREHHAALDLRRHFVIYDRSDQVKAVKAGLEKAGYSPKQFEPRKILSIISKAKGDALTRGEFMESARNYVERVAGEIWEHYEKTLKAEHALDFDDLLLKTLNLLKSHPEILKQYHERFQYIHIDEYQDTNRVQYAIAELLTGKNKNICVVGDIDQCLTGNTKITLANGFKKPIKEIKKGEQVLSNYGSGDYRPALVVRTFKKTISSSLVTIKTVKGSTVTSTKNHLHFAGYRLDTSPQLFFVYLMKKEKVGWRLGVSSVYTKGQKKPMLGFVQRLNQEHGDALWVISTHQTINEARLLEYTLSLKYQLPTIPFVARKGLSVGGYIHDQKALEKIFSNFDTEASAHKLLIDYNLTHLYPHHRPQVSNSERQNILVSLCGDRRGTTPMHRISVAGSNLHTKKILKEAGFSIRPARTGSKSWRFESAHSSYNDIQKLVTKIQKLLPSAIVIETARLGKQTTIKNQKNSLPTIPASSIRAGMVLFRDDGTYDLVKEVLIKPTKKAIVYDLEIANTHNYIANSILTHNSIYSWRGADIKNILQFEKNFPNAKTIFLEENYRSTQTIIAASNDIIEKNVNRPEKKVFTSNHEGEPISLYAAMSGSEEAEYVAMKAKSLINDGASPSHIAVLYRTNFQSRALEEAFLNFGVPYQLLGTKFFERREVKDVLSYLRLALNPGSTADLSRIVNVPTRGIGKVTLLKLIEGKRDELKGVTLAKVEAFDMIMMDIAEVAKQKPLHDTIKFIMKRTGLEEELRKGGEEGLERLENLRELVTLATRYSEYDPEEAVEHFMEDAALQSDQDELKDKEEQDAVRLMTIHASKGLEFPYVFITGLEEGLFPHERLDDSGVDHEEERRLFYVALTRAEKKVFLTFAHMRTIFGSQRVNVPSSFLSDISDDLMESDNPGGGESGYETTVYLD